MRDSVYIPVNQNCQLCKLVGGPFDGQRFPVNPNVEFVLPLKIKGSTTGTVFTYSRYSRTGTGGNVYYEYHYNER